MRPGKAPPNNAFNDQVVGGPRGADAHAKVELPLRAEIDVDRRKELLLLIFQRVEAGERTVRRVVFQPARNLLGEIVTDLHVGRKRYSLVHALAVPGAVKCRVEGQVPGSNFLVDDGADFPRPGIGRKRSPLVTNLIRQTHADRPVPRLWNADSWANVIAHPLPSPVRLNAGEDIKANFSPVVDSLRDLERLVLGMV